MFFCQIGVPKKTILEQGAELSRLTMHVTSLKQSSSNSRVGGYPSIILAEIYRIVLEKRMEMKLRSQGNYVRNNNNIQLRDTLEQEL